MNARVTYGASVVLGILALVLLIANVSLVNSNRHTQDDVNQRQAEINKGNSLASLNQALIQALAEAAVTGNDAAAKDLLAAQGITINPGKSKAEASKPAASTPAPAPAPAEAAPSAKTDKK